MATAAAAGGLAAAAAYLNGKYQIKPELEIIFKSKKAERLYGKARAWQTG